MEGIAVYKRTGRAEGIVVCTELSLPRRNDRLSSSSHFVPYFISFLYQYSCNPTSLGQMLPGKHAIATH